jgi:hypothetical protein
MRGYLGIGMVALLGAAGAAAQPPAPAAAPARGATPFPAPNHRNWSPLGVPSLPPSHYTVPAPGFHSPPPAPPQRPAAAPVLRHDRPAYLLVPPAPREAAYRYYCPDTRLYFPEVRECASAWLVVVAETPRTP